MEIDFLLHIHTLPDDLNAALSDKSNHLYDAATIYKRLIDAGFLWKVWQIDQYQNIWVEVNVLDSDQDPHCHLLVIDPGTYNRVETEPYPIIYEEPE